MPHVFAEFDSDRSGIGTMTISGDPIRRDASNRLGQSEECPGGGKVTMLGQHDVNQSTVAIARYRYRHRPRTRIYVSSMDQPGPILPWFSYGCESGIRWN
jgi:hypothetical protein